MIAAVTIVAPTEMKRFQKALKDDQRRSKAKNNRDNTEDFGARWHFFNAFLYVLSLVTTVGEHFVHRKWKKRIFGLSTNVFYGKMEPFRGGAFSA